MRRVVVHYFCEKELKNYGGTVKEIFLMSDCTVVLRIFCIDGVMRDNEDTIENVCEELNLSFDKDKMELYEG